MSRKVDTGGRVKDSKIDVFFDSKPKRSKVTKKGKNIIDEKPTLMVATSKLQKAEPEDLEEVERLFYSHMWVKCSLV